MKKQHDAARCLVGLRMNLLCAIFVALGGLPAGAAPEALAPPHFPDALHAFVWRNWQVVPLARMAETVGAHHEELAALGAGMGLGAPPDISDEQVRRSYITIIRRNWHLLPYDQLLTLLGWTEARLHETLREDDFLFIKLGSLKPTCKPVRFAPPDEAAQRRAAEISATAKSLWPDGPAHLEQPLFQFVEDLNQPAQPPALPRPKSDAPRIAHSYFALYGDALLETDLAPYPDGYLESLAQLGVNGVWLHGMLSKLAPFPWEPEQSAGYEKRLQNLRALVNAAKANGVGFYLYFNEPRTMPLSFFEGRESLRGITLGDYATLCTSAPEVQEYLSASIAHICREVPDIAGFITITASENPTSCWSHGQGAGCPRCAEPGAARVIAGVNAAIQEGIARSESRARLIAWDWGWGDDWATDAIAALPEPVTQMSVSEWSIPIQRGGVDSMVGEYALSVIGPGPRARKHWQSAQTHGLRTMAKLQVGSTWELGAVPYIPVVANVAKHMVRLRETGIDGAMLGWTLGGYPSPNVAVACALLSDTTLNAEDALHATAQTRYGDDAAAAVVRAWKRMSAAFLEFPYSGAAVYNAPLQSGPSNLLWPSPTGYTATMVGFPYDDVTSWRGPFPTDVFASQLEKVADGFNAALSELDATDNPAVARERDVAQACALHFRSVALQTRFNTARDALSATTDVQHAAGLLDEIEALIRAEQACALQLHVIQQRDSRIGFEATNHYFYVPMDLAEKVLNCNWLLQEWLPAQRARFQEAQ